MLEVQRRAFVSKNKYEEVITELKNKGLELNPKREIVTYFKSDVDFRLLKTKDKLKLWLKTGSIQDDVRENMEVEIDPKYYDNLNRMLKILGFTINLRWYRERIITCDNDVCITIDKIAYYGYVVEIKLSVNSEKEIKKAKSRLDNILKDYGIELTDSVIFQEKYTNYRINWTDLTRNIDDDEFLNSL